MLKKAISCKILTLCCCCAVFDYCVTVNLGISIDITIVLITVRAYRVKQCKEYMYLNLKD